MRKIIYLLTLLLGVSLAACSDETIPEQPEKQEPEQPVEPNPDPEPEPPAEAKLPVLNVAGRYLKMKGRDSQSAWFYADLQPFLQ